jgi:hypothetical protein
MLRTCTLARCNELLRRLREARGGLLAKSRDTFVCGLKGKLMIKNILVAAAIGAAAFGANANEITNGGFESNGLNGSEYCYGCGATGWTGEIVASSSSPAWNNPSAYAGAIDLGTTIDALQQGAVLTSSFSFVVGHSYTLTWDDAGRTSYGTHSYDVLAGGAAFDNFVTTDGQAWSEHSVSFTASATGPLTFKGLFNGGDNTSFIDNVSVITTAVPEASSMLMMSVATLGLLAWRRRARG